MLDIEGSLRGQTEYTNLCYTDVLDIEGSLRAKTELSMLYYRVGYRRQAEGQNRVIYVILTCWI